MTDPATTTAAHRTGTDAPLLDATALAHRYLGRFEALAGVSLSVRAGERVAIVGANGSGKSTLLRVLGGLVFPDAGTYRAFGVAVTEQALEDVQFNLAFRSRVGFVFQNADVQVFSPTVRDELAFGPLHLGMDQADVERRIADVAGMLGLDGLTDRSPHQLSGGQRKRVALASVLVSNPEVLLLDEPTAALDPRTRRWLLDLLGDLAGAGHTVVAATHDLHELERLTDRVIVLGEDHRVLADGTTAEVLADDDLLARANLA